MASYARNSKPIRVSNETLERIEKLKFKNETWDGVLSRLISDGIPLWALPSSLFKTKASAVGAAMKQAVINKESETEKPHRVLRY